MTIQLVSKYWTMFDLDLSAAKITTTGNLGMVEIIAPLNNPQSGNSAYTRITVQGENLVFENGKFVSGTISSFYVSAGALASFAPYSYWFAGSGSGLAIPAEDFVIDRSLYTKLTMLDATGDLAEASAFFGNSGDNTYDARYSTQAWVLEGREGDDTLTGSKFDDAIFGDFQILDTQVGYPLIGGNDVLNGAAGNDLVVGGDGDDRVIGGAGDDYLYGDSDEFSILGTGNDVLIGGTGNDFLSGGGGNDRLYGGAHNDLLHGDAGNDKLYGGTGNDTLFGGDGDDRAYGQAGDDLLFGDAGNDILNGGAGHDSIHGGIGNDKLYGSLGDDDLFGNEGNDLLNGGAGNDFIFGGSGTDTIFTGTGYDMVKFAVGSGANHVKDFEDGADIIDISTLPGAGSGLAWDQIVGYSATQDGTGTVIWYGDDFMVLEGLDVAHLDASDFFIG